VEVEKCLGGLLRSPSQPFICEGWVSGLFSKPVTDKAVGKTLDEYGFE
jgi:hypothetical protein